MSEHRSPLIILVDNISERRSRNDNKDGGAHIHVKMKAIYLNKTDSLHINIWSVVSWKYRAIDCHIYTFIESK